MNDIAERQIIELNNLLHKLLGLEGEDILARRAPELTLDYFRNSSKENIKKIYQILHFYYPSWIAYNTILKSDDKYNEYSSNNELLLALTSIIDWLANPLNEKTNYKKRFISYLEQNLSKEELNALLKDSHIIKTDGKTEKLSSLKAFAQYIYEVRSVIVHRAELGGMYPYNFDFHIDRNAGKIINKKVTINPKDFRRFLWKAIFHSLSLEIILGHLKSEKEEFPKASIFETS